MSQIPRPSTHPTMTHSTTPPSTTLLLIEEGPGGTGATGGTGVVEGFMQRAGAFWGGAREGLTAKETSEKKDQDATFVKNLNKVTKKLLSSGQAFENPETYEAFASFMDAKIAGLLLETASFAAFAVQTSNYDKLYTAGENVGKLDTLASTARRLAKTGGASGIAL